MAEKQLENAETVAIAAAIELEDFECTIALGKIFMTIEN